MNAYNEPINIYSENKALHHTNFYNIIFAFFYQSKLTASQEVIKKCNKFNDCKCHRMLKQSCSVNKETTNVTVTRGMLWSEKL